MLKNLENAFLLGWVPAILLGAALVAPPASASVRVSAVGVADQYSYSTSGFTDPSTYTKKFAFGGGLLFGFPLSPRMEFEVGGLYSPFKIDSTSSDLTMTLSGNRLIVPLTLRFHLAPSISIGVGGFASSGMGKVKASATFMGTSLEQEFSYGDLGQSNLNYGVHGSLGIAIPIGSGTAIILDGRYLMGLKNVLLNATEVGANAKVAVNDIQALVGVRFGGGSH